MRLPHVSRALAFLAALGACAEQSPPNANAYVEQYAITQVPLAFASNSTVLFRESEVSLLALRRDLPADARLSLLVSGGLAEPRARRVGAELDRFVEPMQGSAMPPANGPDIALLSVASRQLIATDCLAPGQPVARDNWPGNDASRARSMPPGCATANAIQQMVVSREDLQQGRPLAPGAALPVGRAIERYYSRSEGAASSPTAAGPPLGAGSSTPVGAPGPAATSAADAGSGLLQGPLQPVAPATAPPAAPAAQ